MAESSIVTTVDANRNTKRRRESDETTSLLHDKKKTRELDTETDTEIGETVDGNLQSNMSADDMKTHIKAAILDPEVLGIIAKAVADAVKADLSQEIVQLKEEIKVVKDTLNDKDEIISDLQRQVEELQQYGRRNGLRIFGIKEKKDENTDKLVLNLAKELGVSTEIGDISRSHRVGPWAKSPDRPILVKFVSYRERNEFIRARSKLKGREEKVYINEDLSKQRAKLSKRAREMKKNKRITDSWTADGTIFLKLLDETTVRRVISDRDIDALVNDKVIPA